MPSFSVTSSGLSRPLRWTRMPFRLIRPARDGTVTSMTFTPPARSSHSAAPLLYDNLAPGPHANTAASQYPSRLRRSCPYA